MDRTTNVQVLQNLKANNGIENFLNENAKEKFIGTYVDDKMYADLYDIYYSLQSGALQVCLYNLGNVSNNDMVYLTSFNSEGKWDTEYLIGDQELNALTQSEREKFFQLFKDNEGEFISGELNIDDFFKGKYTDIAEAYEEYLPEKFKERMTLCAESMWKYESEEYLIPEMLKGIDELINELQEA